MKTFLQHLGNALKKVLGIGVEVAEVAEPVIAVEFPEVVSLYQSTLGLATQAEALAPTATGTGPQKLEQLVAAFLPQATAWAEKNGVKWPEDEIKKWASAVVDTINLIPAPVQASAPASLPETKPLSGVLASGVSASRPQTESGLAPA